MERIGELPGYGGPIKLNTGQIALTPSLDYLKKCGTSWSTKFFIVYKGEDSTGFLWSIVFVAILCGVWWCGG